MEHSYYAGGPPAVLRELVKADLLAREALSVQDRAL